MTKKIKVNKKTFKGDWPFVPGSGILKENRSSVTIVLNGIEYSLNGPAAQSKKYLPLNDEVWKRNPDIPGAKMSLTGIIRLAIKKC